jgi:hypothetical protein
MVELDPVEVKFTEDAPVVIKDIDLGENPVVKIEGTKQEPIQNEDNEGIELLRRQLEEKRREAEEAKRLKAEAERYAQQREREVKTYQVQAQDNQLVAFTNAIASFERDAEMLERDYATTLQEGDYAKAAKLQRQMAQVESRLTQLAQGKEALEERLNVQKQNLRNPPQQQASRQSVDPIEAQIQAVQSPTSQAWLRSHKDVLADPAKTALMTAGHWEAVAKNIQPDTPEYFQYIENKVYGTPESVSQAPAPRQTRQTMASAPVSRSSTPVMRSGGEIQMHLTPEMREIAEMNGMTDEEYARARLYYMNKGEIRG